MFISAYSFLLNKKYSYMFISAYSFPLNKKIATCLFLFTAFL